MTREIFDCTLARWQPGIGDPTWQGWATVALYLVVSLLALRVAGRGAFPAATMLRERRFWIVVAVLMLMLAINKQLDLQSALTAAGRCMAKAQGWYQDRRSVQLGFLIALAGAALLLVVTILLALRGTLARSGLPALGLGFVCAFVLMRAVSFHHADRLLGAPMGGLRTNTILEWAGPLLIAAGALMIGTSRRRKAAGFRRSR